MKVIVLHIVDNSGQKISVKSALNEDGLEINRDQITGKYTFMTTKDADPVTIVHMPLLGVQDGMNMLNTASLQDFRL